MDMDGNDRQKGKEVSLPDRVMEFLNRFFLAAGGIALLFLMGIAAANVLFRIVHVPFRGTYEFVSFLGAVATASALGYTQSQKGHILVNILSERFPAPLRAFLDRISALLNGLFFSLISWQIFLWGARIARSGEVSETLKIIYHPFIHAVALGFAVLALTCFAEGLRGLSGAEGLFMKTAALIRRVVPLRRTERNVEERG
jgi:TRAP-type C4-dicarboxylate transport system permease small subunit